MNHNQEMQADLSLLINNGSSIYKYSDHQHLQEKRDKWLFKPFQVNERTEQCLEGGGDFIGIDA